MFLLLLHKFFDSFVDSSLFFVIISALWLYFAGTFFFDCIHYLLHRFSKSSYRPLRILGDLHLVHHLYFNRRLKFNEVYRWHNMFFEIPLELLCQLIGDRLGWVAAKYLGLIGPAKAPEELLALVALVQMCRVTVVLLHGGRDSNHISYYPVPKDPNWFVVGPEYHVLHHISPDRYMGSAFRVFDWLFGLVSSLKSKRIVMTGANGAFGSALKDELLQESVACISELKYGRDWRYDDYESSIPILTNADILILAHGSKGPEAQKANCDTAIALIDLFRRHRKSRPGFDIVMPEIWYISSESELHPSWGIESLQRYSRSKRAFLPTAYSLYNDPSVMYRHIVPASFRSPMGPALVSAEWAAGTAMWWIRRGARYVPATYTGIAFVNWAKFLWLAREQRWRRGVKTTEK